MEHTLLLIAFAEFTIALAWPPAFILGIFFLVAWAVSVD